MSDISSYDFWHQSATNLCEVIVIHYGPDALGRNYIDGLHQHTIEIFDTPEAALAACNRHNGASTPTKDQQEIGEGKA